MTDPLEIHNGPNKYDLMMGLFERKNVTFMFNHNDMRVQIHSLAHPSSSTVQSLRPYSSFGRHWQQKDVWLFYATIVETPGCKTYLLDMEKDEESSVVVNGHVVGVYSDKTRKGSAVLDRSSRVHIGYEAHLTEATNQISDVWADPRLLN